MAQPAMNAKIEELRFRLKTDPKNRLFYQLAEELRKAGQFAESEQVLRTGLEFHPSYLAAWVSLGRTLRELKKDQEAVEALSKALQLDPGNMVAARLLGDAYMALGEKIEAIKKYKLVHALLPADEELEAMIDTLDRELNPPVLAPSPALVPMEDSPFDRTLPPFSDAATVLGEEADAGEATGDSEPMHLAHEESPFEEPVADYTAAAVTVEGPVGMHIASAPLGAEVPAMMNDDLPTIDAPLMAPEAPPEARPEMPPEMPLEAQPADEADVFEPVKEVASGETSEPKIARLEGWLSKVGRKEAGSV